MSKTGREYKLDAQLDFPRFNRYLPLRYFEMNMDLYKKLINSMNKRIEAAKFVIENI
jgi:hypothetical protein